MAHTDSRFPVLPRTSAKAHQFVSQGLVPGAIIAWGSSKGPVHYYGAGTLGFAREELVDERSIFRIFSQTKPVTGVAAMMLIEDGIIRLDQPLDEILPEFSDMQVCVDGDTATTRRAVSSITVRHLLTHTAGFGMAGMTLSDLYIANDIAPGSNGRRTDGNGARLPTTLKDMVARLATLPLATDPGTRFDYSVATDVLGRVIEVASGMPFDAFLASRLFEPLQMVDTAFHIPAKKTARFADLPEKQGTAWALADDPVNSRYANPPFPSGGGGLLSTAHDYSRFAAMLLNKGELDGVRVLQAKTVALARSNLLPADISHCELPIGETLSGVGFGAAMSVSMTRGERTGGMFDWPGSVPPGVFGWPGAAGTACWMDPETDFFLLLLTQYWPSWLNGGMRPDLIAAAYDDLRPIVTDQHNFTETKA
jgi:CubicO group peptidase (beta-lactamase class C family)